MTSAPEAAATDRPGTIVVGIDGSPTSLRAGAYAAGEARRTGARILVVHVLTIPLAVGLAPAPAMGLVVEGLTEQARDVAELVVARARAVGVGVEVIVVRGSPSTEIARVADEARADEVVVGAPGHATHRVIGSVGSRLARTGNWPVTVVP
jgi:nucleotide-binding universal stress UspA family protein